MVRFDATGCLNRDVPREGLMYGCIASDCMMWIPGKREPVGDGIEYVTDAHCVLAR